MVAAAVRKKGCKGVPGALRFLVRHATSSEIVKRNHMDVSTGHCILTLSISGTPLPVYTSKHTLLRTVFSFVLRNLNPTFSKASYKSGSTYAKIKKNP